MRFAEIAGGNDVKRALIGMVDRDNIPHAIMFHENDGGGGLALALAFLQYLYCHQRGDSDSCGSCPSCSKITKLIHPDVHFVFPVASTKSIDKPRSEDFIRQWRELVIANPYFLENELFEALGLESKATRIAVQEARAVLDSLSLSAVERGYRSVVVYLPEKMNAEAANRLLKSIEEPPELTQFIFITHAPEQVLMTIRSRCEFIRVLPLSVDEVAGVLEEKFGRTPEEARAAAVTAGGSIGRALAYSSDNENIEAEQTLFSALMNALATGNLNEALEVGEDIASLPSRERIQAFCRYASEALRKIFVIQQGLPQLAPLTPREEQFIPALAGRLKKSFSRVALPHIDRARMLLERNVNAKILFCDLVDKLYILIWKTQN